VLHRRAKIPERLAFFLAIVISFGGLIVLFYVLVPPLIAQTQELIKVLPAYITGWEAAIDRLAERVPALKSVYTPGQHKILFAIYEQVSGQFGNVVPKVLSLVEVLVSLFSVVVMGLYLALHPALYREWLIALFPPIHRDLVRDVLADCAGSLRAYIVGLLLTMTFLGTLTAIGLAALKVPYALTFGVFTGLATIGPELVGKQLEMLRAVAPKVSRVAILKNPNQPTHARAARQAEDAGRALGIRVQVLDARTPSEIEAAFAAMRTQRAGGVLILRDAVFRAQGAQIVALAARSRLPAMYGLREQAEIGGLISYGASVPHLFQRAASYVDRILKGARPADLPVEQPTKFELVINLKTAKALALTVPPELLGQADHVIQ